MKRFLTTLVLAFFLPAAVWAQAIPGRSGEPGRNPWLPRSYGALYGPLQFDGYVNGSEPANPRVGDVIWSLTDDGLRGWTGAAWVSVGGGGSLPVGVNNNVLTSDGASGAVSETSVNIVGSTLSVGVAGASTGIVELDGSTSGTVTLQPANAAGTWTLTLPANNGNAGDVLTNAAGDGVASWAAAAAGGAWTSAAGFTDPNVAADTVRVINSAAGTNTVVNKFRLQSVTSATAVAGFGVSLDAELEENDGTNRVAAAIDFDWSDAGEGASADGRISFRTMIADSAATDILVLDGGTATATVTGTLNATTLLQGGAGIPDITGTPANNQLALFTDANTLEGDPDLTWTGTAFTIENDGAGATEMTVRGSGQTAQFNLESFNNDSSAGAFSFRKTRGSFASPTDTQDGDGLGSFVFRGYASNGHRGAVNINAEQDGAVSGATVPGKLILRTVPAGGATTTRLEISSTGIITLGDGATSTSADSPTLTATGGSGATNAAGDFTIQAGLSTDDADAGTLIFKTGDGISAGASTLQAPQTYMTIDGVTGGDDAKVQIETQLVLKEISIPTDIANYAQLYTTSANDLRYVDGAGVDHSLVTGDGVDAAGASMYLAANTNVLDLEEADEPHGIADYTVGSLDGDWTFKAGSNAGTAGTITVTAVANSGAGLIRCTTSGAHGLSVPTIVTIVNTSDGTDLPNGVYEVTVASDATHFDLDGSTFTDTTATADWQEPSHFTAGANDAGDYEVGYHLAGSVAAGTPTFLTRVYKNTVVQAEGTMERKVSTTDIGVWGGTSDIGAIISGDKVFLTFESTTTNDPLLKYGRMSVSRKNASTGGTLRPEIIIEVVSGTTDVGTGDGQVYFTIPADLDGKNLTAVHGRVITAGTTGTTDIEVYNVTAATDMLSTTLTIDSGEVASDTAATPAVVGAGGVSLNDLLRLDIDAVSTTEPKGLVFRLQFEI